jgi:methylenetetrahydrofolate dehydrogenase (NADP+)/methenyltetrahydrofolate cyclohydrolase
VSAAVLSGVALAEQIRGRTEAAARALTAAGAPPTLAVVVATTDESSAWYVRSIARSAARAAVACDVIDLGPDATVEELGACLLKLNDDPGVHGIILQTPLPASASLEHLTPMIDQAKDVDGANPASLGRLMAGHSAFAPATAEAVLALLDHHGVDLAGRHPVVVGRSTVVGKPVAHLLLRRDATVTVCHSGTAKLALHTRQADALVVAVGRARMVTAEHVRAGAVVVDVGTNPSEAGTVVGDVDSHAVAEVAGGLTPVPGGIGPITAMLLLAHTVRAAEQLSIS